MAFVNVALASCLAILAFPRALGEAQCESSGAKCGDSLLQRVELEATEVAVDEGEGSENITSVTQDPAEWSQEPLFEVVAEPTYVNLNKCGGGTYSSEAFVIGPSCKPPSGGYPGLIFLPGKGGFFSRQIAFAKSFAGRGIVTMAVGACGASGKIYEFKWAFYQAWGARYWMVSETWEYFPYHGGQKMGVNPEDISLVGYSAGAEFVNGLITCSEVYCINKALTGSRAFKSLISIAGIKDTHRTANLDHLDQSSPKYLAVQAKNDHLMPFAAVEPFVKNLKEKGVDAHFIQYEGGGHQPFKPSMLYLISKFILAPNDYTDPTFPLPNDGEITATWETFPDEQKAFACIDNSDGITPLEHMKFDTFNNVAGRYVCRNMCLDTKTCVGFDLLSSREHSAEGGLNCVLYDQKCTTPKKRSNEYSEWLTSGVTSGNAATSYYCTSSSTDNLRNSYTRHSSTNCGIKNGESENVAEVLIGETFLSCADACNNNPDCTAFQLGVNDNTLGKWVARCLLKKAVVLNLCATSNRWNLFMKKN